MAKRIPSFITFESKRACMEKIKAIHPNLDTDNIIEFNGAGGPFKILCKVCNNIINIQRASHLYTLSNGYLCASCSHCRKKSYIDKYLNLFDSRKDKNDYKIINFLYDEKDIKKELKVIYQHTLCGNTSKVSVRDFINRNTRCYSCFGPKIKSHEQFEREVHEKWGKIIFITKYINIKSNITYLCPKCNNIKQARAENLIHKETVPCANCYTTFNKKINEHITFDVLQELFGKENVQHNKFTINVQHKNKIRTLRCDFYIQLPNKSIVVEYNGEAHYMPVIFGNMTQKSAKNKFKDQQIRDKLKKAYCIKNGIKFIQIDGRKYKGKAKIKKYLIERLRKDGILKELKSMDNMGFIK